MRATATILLVAALALAACGGDDGNGNGNGGGGNGGEAEAARTRDKATQICAGLAARLDEFNRTRSPQPSDVRRLARDMQELLTAAQAELQQLQQGAEVIAFDTALGNVGEALTKVESAAGGNNEQRVNAATAELERALAELRRTGTALGAERC